MWPGHPAYSCPASDAWKAAAARPPQPGGSPSTGAPEKPASEPEPSLQRPGDTAAVGLGEVTTAGAGLAPMEAPGYAASRLPTWTWARSLVTPGHNTQPGESARERQSSQHSLLLIMSYDVGSLISAFISVPGFREKNNYFLFFSWKVRSSC